MPGFRSPGRLTRSTLTIRRGASAEPPGQLVSFDFKGGERWYVFPSVSAWLRAFQVGLEGDPAEDAVYAAKAWSRARPGFFEVQLPEGLERQRSKQRFEAAAGPWTERRHPDGRVWAIRARRGGDELRLGEGDDAVTRQRSCADPSAEMERLLGEQEAEGFHAGLAAR